MLIEEQIHARQERAKEAVKRILSKPKGKPFGDYHLLSTSGQEYRVAMRGPGACSTTIAPALTSPATPWGRASTSRASWSGYADATALS